ncbi:MAG: hypothetical protein K8F91_18645 [Candidatus Obscuribacterales bacterium]|nr:hypothetical protein [Candidatus Obscuribacterales bacterium]
MLYATINLTNNQVLEWFAAALKRQGMLPNLDMFVSKAVANGHFPGPYFQVEVPVEKTGKAITLTLSEFAFADLLQDEARYRGYTVSAMGVTVERYQQAGPKYGILRAEISIDLPEDLQPPVSTTMLLIAFVVGQLIVHLLLSAL